jgi:hypothetical protein
VFRQLRANLDDILYTLIAKAVRRWGRRAITMLCGAADIVMPAGSTGDGLFGVDAAYE